MLFSFGFDHVWPLSPPGGQAALRLLTTDSFVVTTAEQQRTTTSQVAGRSVGSLVVPLGLVYPSQL